MGHFVAGTDEKAIIDVISQRSNQQRQEIMRMFKTMYGKDLIRDLESELSGDFRETIMALFKATTYYDAWSLYQAMSVSYSYSKTCLKRTLKKKTKIGFQD